LCSVALAQLIYGTDRVGRPTGGRIPLTSSLSRAAFRSNANSPAVASPFQAAWRASPPLLPPEPRVPLSTVLVAAVATTFLPSRRLQSVQDPGRREGPLRNHNTVPFQLRRSSGPQNFPLAPDSPRPSVHVRGTLGRSCPKSELHTPRAAHGGRCTFASGEASRPAPSPTCALYSSRSLAPGISWNYRPPLPARRSPGGTPRGSQRLRPAWPRSYTPSPRGG